eukprot:TRINITY_DN13623_c0_g1_i1.p1 TRINITY_DN13623_c0_g1~~TRINITY_DN13623_c0_g1_i1.p1  ORF type:complete len:251 (-),score=38.02 TRINITY_DN13623_c0_g1_i1:799-1551(-)
MESTAMSSNPRTVEEVFKDFTGRREGMLKALTKDVEDFYTQCDPDKENLCLYGYPDETWEVNLPAEEVPPELPEPALGINFARDGMNRKDWLSLVAVHSDAWLLAVAFYYGARFDKDERGKLFLMINNLPTVFDVVTGKKSPKKAVSANNSTGASNSKAKKEIKRTAEATPRSAKAAKVEEPPPEEEDEEEEHGDTFCGVCGGPYASNEFWIGCDICEKWYHGQCVRITPAKAESIKQYKCPACSKRPRS